VFWHDSVRNLVSTLKERSTPVIAVAHEYFDALPVYRFQFSEQRGWCEELVDISRAPLDAESQDVSPLPLRLVLSPGPTPPAMVCLGPSPPAQVGGRVEVSPDSQSDMQQLARLLKQGGGAALVVDYGQWGPAANSLRAIVEHKFVEPMEQPAGEADLSVDVDFRYISNAARKEGAHTAFLTQRDFLRKTGVEVLLVNQLKKCATEEEAEELISQYNRIVDEMGEVYKVLMVSSDVSVIKDFQ
jgi:NADH dehydrogenase [ubiquinone] 1 alpha subcomplex assembly factor 7